LLHTNVCVALYDFYACVVCIELHNDNKLGLGQFCEKVTVVINPYILLSYVTANH